MIVNTALDTRSGHDSEALSVPDEQWSPGYGYITPGRWIRLWGRDHVAYDAACVKGPRRGTNEVSCHVYIDDGEAVIHAHRRDNRHNDTPMDTLHGDRFPTVDDAHRALFEAGWIVFEETVRTGTVGPYVPPWGIRDPDDVDGYLDDRVADGMAADMVFGRSR